MKPTSLASLVLKCIWNGLSSTLIIVRTYRPLLNVCIPTKDVPLIILNTPGNVDKCDTLLFHLLQMTTEYNLQLNCVIHWQQTSLLTCDVRMLGKHSNLRMSAREHGLEPYSCQSETNMVSPYAARFDISCETLWR